MTATILIIEDDPAVRRMMVRILAQAKYEIIEAGNGEEGLKMFLAHRPDIIITDLLMPEKEGIETIREIRRTAPTVPILAASGGGDTRNMMFLDLAKALGADEVLSKPFRAEELITTVARMLPS